MIVATCIRTGTTRRFRTIDAAIASGFLNSPGVIRLHQVDLVGSAVEQEASGSPRPGAPCSTTEPTPTPRSKA